MNNLKDYTIRLCRKDEIVSLQHFIKQSWHGEHIFVQDKSVLDWQHLEGEKYNFVVAFHEPTQTFHGVLGIIAPSFYASGYIQKHDDIWLAIWKVNKAKAQSNSLGMDLLEFVKEQYSPRTISAIGINQQVALLYRLMGFRIAKMNHVFILNPEKDTFSIAHIQNRVSSESTEALANIAEIAADALPTIKPAIAQWGRFEHYERYLQGRFAEHPQYHYRFFSVTHDQSVEAVFVARKITVKGESCLRIVDWSAKPGFNLHLLEAMQALLVKENSEYIDMIHYGMQEDEMMWLGGQTCTEDNYVPHLFEPFVENRVEVQIAYLSDSDFLCFKGDSDLDRPNQLINHTV